jgi:alpha-tubulin suppressor-like RCC1 family protein
VDSNWFQVEAGAKHSVALKTDGTLWTWGANESGQLGIGSTSGSATPVRVGLESAWVEVRAGGNFTLARRADGTIWGWGTNQFGQLGLGTNTGRALSPTLIGTNSDWTNISAGVSHSLGLRADGTLWAWGRGEFGQLGLGSTTNGATTNVLAPMRLGSDSDWRFIEAGSFHSFGIKTDGRLFAWGANWFGQLGDGSSGSVALTNQGDKYFPVPIGTNTWLAVDASTHSLGLDMSGRIWAWGWNSHGQIGNGTTNNSNVPVLLVFTNVLSTSTSNAPPTISVQPTNQFAIVGETTSFSVNATGAPPLVYQWYFNSNSISIGVNATAASAMFSLTNVQGADAGFYHAIITNGFGGITSVVASLTVSNTNGIVFFPNGTSVTNGSPPVITQQPSNHVAFTNETAVFGVVATGSGTLLYQWRFNDNPLVSSTNLIATNATLVITNVQVNNDGFYDVVVRNNLGVTTSAPVRLRVVTNEVGSPSLSAAKKVVFREMRLSFGAMTETGMVAHVSGADAARNYILEFTESLVQPQWTPLSTNRGPVTTLVDPSLPPRSSRFYRLREE